MRRSDDKALTSVESAIRLGHSGCAERVEGPDLDGQMNLELILG
jgi:hypothetical protein